MGSKHTAWHFYFCLLLRRYGPKVFEIRDEVPLSEEPPRMDFLILRRLGELSASDPGETLVELWPLLPRVTIDLGHGYWRVLGGKFAMFVAEIDAVADQPDEDLLGLYAHNVVRTPRAIKFWGELAGREAEMELQEMEGYQEAIEQVMSAIPPEQRLAGLTDEQRLAGLAPEKRLAGLAPEQRLAGLTDEQRLDLLRVLSATLPEATRAEVAKRLATEK